MALPTSPRPTEQEEDLHDKFLNEVMGVGSEPELPVIPEPEPDEASPFAGSLTLDEVFDNFAENDAMVQEREDEKTWEKFQPRIQEHASTRIILWVIVAAIAAAAAVLGAIFLVDITSPEVEPVVVEQNEMGYTVPERNISG